MYIFQPINNSVQDSFIAIDNNDTWRSLFQTPPPVSTCHCYVVYTYVMRIKYAILNQEPPLNSHRIHRKMKILRRGNYTNIRKNANFRKTVNIFGLLSFLGNVLIDSKCTEIDRLKKTRWLRK